MGEWVEYAGMQSVGMRVVREWAEVGVVLEWAERKGGRGARGAGEWAVCEYVWGDVVGGVRVMAVCGYRSSAAGGRLREWAVCENGQNVRAG
eukprot:701981-Pleurochrysis_carterae.AAC.2